MPFKAFIRSHWNRWLILIGSAGLAFFLYAYPGQNPDSTASKRISSSDARDISNFFLAEIGYKTLNEDARVRFNRDNDLSRQLQHQIGRATLNRIYDDEIINRLPVMYWSVQQDNVRDVVLRGTGSEATWDVSLGIRVGAGGRVIHFSTDKPDSLAQLFNPVIFDGTPVAELYQGLPLDELTSENLAGLFRFDLQSESARQPFRIDFIYQNSAGEQDASAGFTDTLRMNRTLYRNDLRLISGFHLARSGWDPALFEIDTMRVITGKSNTQARVRYRSTRPVIDHNILVNLDVAATGQLLGMNYSTTPLNPRVSIAGEEIWNSLSGIGLVLTGIVAFIVFIRRFSLRLIDSKSALSDTILGAFVLASVVMISTFNDLAYYGSMSAQAIGGMLVGTFFMAAVGGVLYFMLASTSASISYGVMPDKIRSLNLARSGYTFNLPVGKALLQGFFTAGILLGIYTLTLSAFPREVFYLENSLPFTDYFLFGQTMGHLVASILMATFVVYSLYLILGAMVYGEKRRVVLFLLVTIIVWILSAPLNTGLASPWLGITAVAILGAIVSAIYLRYDALTTIAALFFAGMLLRTFDVYLTQPAYWGIETLFSLGIITGLVVTGAAGVKSLKSGDELPSFVPVYILEHANRQRMQRELEIARQVQMSFLPHSTPKFNDLDMAANCRAASEVGGDYYDFIQLDDHRMAVVIGDVSGKGIQAAFYMTLVKGFIQSLSHHTHDPATFLTKLNTLFCRNVNKGTFVSLIFGVIDTRNHTFTFGRAGHNPIIYHPNGNGSPVMLNTSGLAIGMVPDGRFEDNIEVQTIEMNTMDTLVLYTDGYSEAMDPSKNIYGENKLLDVIRKNPSESANGLLEAINRDVNRFAGHASQHDDMTMLVIRYTVLREATLEPHMSTESMTLPA